MTLGAYDSNPIRLARFQALNQDGGNVAEFALSQDVDGHNIPKRIRLKMITIQASQLIGFTFRIFSTAARVNTPGADGFSLVSEKLVAPSPIMPYFLEDMPYTDEDAVADNYIATWNENRAQIFCQLITNAGVNVDYSIGIYFTQ